MLRRAHLKSARVFQLADQHWIETSVTHQPSRNFHRFGIIAGDRHGELGIGTVRFTCENHVTERVESANQPRTGQIFLRGHTDAVLVDFVDEPRRRLARRFASRGAPDVRLAAGGEVSTVEKPKYLLIRSGLTTGSYPGASQPDWLRLCRIFR